MVKNNIQTHLAIQLQAYHGDTSEYCVYKYSGKLPNWIANNMIALNNIALRFTRDFRRRQ